MSRKEQQMNLPTANSTAPGRAGMTLVEIIVAMTVFAIVMAGILPLSIFVIGYARENTRTMQARNLMSNMAEQLHSLPPTATWRADPDSGTADLDDNTVTADYSITNGSYGIRWNINTTSSTIQDVKIFINWTGPGNHQKSISSQFTLIRS